jgi:hypothetical protein
MMIKKNGDKKAKCKMINMSSVKIYIYFLPKKFKIYKLDTAIVKKL